MLIQESHKDVPTQAGGDMSEQLSRNAIEAMEADSNQESFSSTRPFRTIPKQSFRELWCSVKFIKAG